MNAKHKKRHNLSVASGSCKKIAKVKDKPIEVSINSEYFDETFKEAFSNAFNKKVMLCHDNGAEVYAKPFTTCVLPNFIQQNDFVDSLKDELLDLTFYDKNNDLYKFHQSDDLKTASSPYITALRKLLYEDFASWLKDICGIPFTDVIDMTCSLYDYTDVLLCHDDELEGRRIAFILYLVPTWSSGDGGTLDLFSSDVQGQPDKVVKSLVPVWNNFVFFEVSPVSFHQVSEVITKDKTRISISGWLHGPPFKRSPMYTNNFNQRITPCHVELEVLKSWLNPIYLEADIQMQIQENFENDSEIELKDFLKEEKYAIVAEAFMDNNVQWISKGPANKRYYQVAEEKNLPQPVLECLQVLKSEAMFLLLSNMTGLNLHNLANSERRREESVDDCKKSDLESVKENSGPTCEAEVRQWKHGSYTLAYDADMKTVPFALDATLYFNCQDWIKEHGGFTSYIAKGEDEELLTIVPFPNSLTLVYRDQDALRFVKHINYQVNERAKSLDGFHDIYLMYYE